jgi:hypothetical protein
MSFVTVLFLLQALTWLRGALNQVKAVETVIYLVPKSEECTSYLPLYSVVLTHKGKFTFNWHFSCSAYGPHQQCWTNRRIYSVMLAEAPAESYHSVVSVADKISHSFLVRNV